MNRSKFSVIRMDGSLGCSEFLMTAFSEALSV
jgi:hypothetical protein